MITVATDRHRIEVSYLYIFSKHSFSLFTFKTIIYQRYNRHYKTYMLTGVERPAILSALSVAIRCNSVYMLHSCNILSNWTNFFFRLCDELSLLGKRILWNEYLFLEIFMFCFVLFSKKKSCGIKSEGAVLLGKGNNKFLLLFVQKYKFFKIALLHNKTSLLTHVDLSGNAIGDRGLLVSIHFTFTFAVIDYLLTHLETIDRVWSMDFAYWITHCTFSYDNDLFSSFIELYLTMLRIIISEYLIASWRTSHWRRCSSSSPMSPAVFSLRLCMYNLSFYCLFLTRILTLVFFANFGILGAWYIAEQRRTGDDKRNDQLGNLFDDFWWFDLWNYDCCLFVFSKLRVGAMSEEEVRNILSIVWFVNITLRYFTRQSRARRNRAPNDARRSS